MKKLHLFILLLFSGICAAQEETEFIEYSFSEFFQMIENEKDSIFYLKNALIELDTILDKAYLGKIVEGVGNYEPIRKDTIFIKKELHLENVHFDIISGQDRTHYGILNHFVFLETVSLTNVSGRFKNALFNKRLRIDFNQKSMEYRPVNLMDRTSFLSFDECTINDISFISQYDSKKVMEVAVRMESCMFNGAGRSLFFVNYLRSFNFSKNRFARNKAVLGFSLKESNRILIEENDFNTSSLEILIAKSQNQSIQIVDNTFNNSVVLGVPESIEDIRIDWNQFKAGVVDQTGYYNFFQKEYFPKLSDSVNDYLLKPEVISEYKDLFIVPVEKYYKSEVRLLGTLNAIYKRQHDMQSANASYIALKDLETERLQYVYKEQPSFDTYFEWKVNQFLKLFSDYGTRPAKAITFSVYVILLFALIYLFFPNHWDSHGKNRIMDRYRFFLKYVNKDSGIHEVYLEEQQPELLNSEDFKSYLLEKGKTAPKFFMATAMPLYKWSVAGTKTFSWLLSKVDVLKGTWDTTEPHKKAGKSILIFGAFLIAIIYDLFIKVLNALMLSINTFTTLGFGEIPIKGLPRYLAIIQGFIGWFMLTIFSVSLISQLLN